LKKTTLAVGLLLAAVGLSLWFFGRPAYRHYQERRALQQARQFLAKGDWRNASVSARQAIQLHPANLEACRIMADLAEAAHSVQALDWRRRVAELAPTLENKLLLAAIALRSQGPPFPLASQMLEDLRQPAQDVASYHLLLAERALKLNQPAEAEAQFVDASRLEPTNELHQFNLAVLRLRSTNVTSAAEARASLERLRASTNLGAVALRWLIGDRLGQKDLPAAERFSSQLLADPHATFEDRLQHLGILRQQNLPQYPAFLLTVKSEALTNAVKVYSLSSWMLSQKAPDEAMPWLSSLPPKLAAEQPVPLAFVDAYAAKKDWAGLDNYLQDQKWGELEFLRLAFLSHAAAEQRENLAAETRWRSAVRQAGDRLGALNYLLTLAGAWHADKSCEDLLWQIAQRFPREHWALVELGRFYLASQDTRGINKVSAALASFNPKDLMAKNNFATTALLLNLNLAAAHQTAKEIYTQHPDDPIITSTYAWSLHRQGQTKEALAALEKLKPEGLELPNVALYYGLLLSADGQHNKAAKYLALAQSAALLPEEKSLLAAAAPPK
jgi:hypothetical protein